MCFVCRLPVLLLICLISLAAPAFADYYRYRDDSGTLNFTDDPKNVPAKYRKQAERVKEAPVPPPAAEEPPPALPEPAVVPAPPPPTLQEKLIAAWHESPWLPLAAFAVAAVVGFFLLGRLLCHLQSAQLTRLIYLVFFLGIGVLGFKLYADYMNQGLKTLKGKTETLMQRANRREAPAAPAE